MRFQDLVEWSPIGIGVYQRGRIVYANPAAVSILRAGSVQDLIGSDAREHLPGSAWAHIGMRLRRFMRSVSQAPRHEEQLLCLDGALVDVEIQGARIDFEGAPALQICFVDVSDRKRAETSLRESQYQYQSLVEWSPFGLCVVQRGTIVYVNAAALRIWGAAIASDLVGTPIFARIHPKQRAATMERISAIAQSGEHASLRSMQFLKTNGRTVEVECHASAFLFQGQQAIHLSFQDIGARSLTERALRESEERFRVLTELSSDWYWEQDESLRFTVVSEQVHECLGLPAQAHLGKAWWDLPTDNISAQEWDAHKELMAQRQSFRDWEICRRDSASDEPRWASVSGAPKFDAQGVFRGYRGVGRDITAQKLDAQQIHQLAYYDTLTRLPNRRMLTDRLARSLQSAQRHGTRGALLFIDLDNFKSLNDTLGHDVGDILLQQVATRLVASVRACDTVARLGGDEFVVVVEDLDPNGLTAAAQADAIGQKILLALNAPYQLAGRDHVSSPSVGITLFGSEPHSVDDLLRQADLAMYQAKAAGRNAVSFFDARMQDEVDQRVALESDLRDGLHDGEELELYFQPMVSASGRVSGAEALVRWQQPVRGLVMPDAFIPLAESTGLIVPLGRWVLKSACEHLAQWSRTPHAQHLVLSVNISARELSDPHFVSYVRNALQRSGAPANRLRLELTESVLVDKIDDTAAKMEQIRAMGVGFSLDDFGTGYSSLTYLKRLPLDLLKIDRSFVRDILTDPNDAAIARTIVALGHSLRLQVVAEGVEAEDQRAFLGALGCSGYQGRLFAEPMPAAAFEEWLVRQRAGWSVVAMAPSGKHPHPESAAHF
ncbi:MAG: EAL domain-containing protein [Rhodoferax sp.]